MSRSEYPAYPQFLRDWRSGTEQAIEKKNETQEGNEDSHSDSFKQETGQTTVASVWLIVEQTSPQMTVVLLGRLDLV